MYYHKPYAITILILLGLMVVVPPIWFIACLIWPAETRELYQAFWASVDSIPKETIYVLGIQLVAFMIGMMFKIHRDFREF